MVFQNGKEKQPKFPFEKCPFLTLTCFSWARDPFSKPGGGDEENNGDSRENGERGHEFPETNEATILKCACDVT